MKVYLIHRDETDGGDAWDKGTEALRLDKGAALALCKELAEQSCEENGGMLVQFTDGWGNIRGNQTTVDYTVQEWDAE